MTIRYTDTSKKRAPLTTYAAALVFSFFITGLPMAENPSSKVARPRVLDDSTPVTAAIAYSPEYVERFTMLGVDYCVPRIASLEIHKPLDGSSSNGGNAALDAETFTNSNPPPWRKGEENPLWVRRIIVEVTSSRQDWGFPGLFKAWTGKDLTDVTESDLSPIEDVRSTVEAVRRGTAPGGNRDFLLRVDGKLTHVRWRPTGGFVARYSVGEGVIGRVTVREEHADRLPLLIEVASKFFRPCKTLAP